MSVGLAKAVWCALLFLTWWQAAPWAEAVPPQPVAGAAVPKLTPTSFRILPPVAVGAAVDDKSGATSTKQDNSGLRLAPDHLFRLESEQAFRERLGRELAKVKNVQFPNDVPLAEGHTPITIPPGRVVGPVSVPTCYRPLYFEDKRSERFGEYVPCLQPFVSTVRFYGDLMLLPCRMVAAPPWTFECDNR